MHWTADMRGGGSVYFASSDGRIKIGTTTYGVPERLTQISAHLAVPLTLIGSIPGGLKLERAVQHHLKGFLIKGEWFRDCEDVRRVVTDLIKRGPKAAIGFVPPRAAAGLVRGDLEASCAEHRDENLSRMIKRIWPTDTAQSMGEFLGLSVRLCQVFIDQEASAPRVVRLAVFAAFLMWVRKRDYTVWGNLGAVAQEHVRAHDRRAS